MFSALYRNGLWVFPIFFLVGLVVLVFSIRNLVQMWGRKLLFSVPLVAEQSVTFAEAGRVALYGEGPLLTSRFAHLKFELIGDDGETLKGRPILFFSRATTMSQVRLQLRKFNIPRPGRYTLRVSGLGEPRANDAEHRFVFTRPQLAATMAFVVLLTLSAFPTIGGLVLFLLRLTGAGKGPDS